MKSFRSNDTNRMAAIFLLSSANRFRFCCCARGKMQVYNEPNVSGYAPTFFPTKEEFANFSAYIRKIEPKVIPYGICKVVPPAGWRAASPQRYAELEQRVPLVRRPMRQTAQPSAAADGKPGIYDVRLTWLPDMPLDAFRAAADDARRSRHRVPAKATLDEIVRHLLAASHYTNKTTQANTHLCCYTETTLIRVSILFLARARR
jgi:hypothetical protein